MTTTFSTEFLPHTFPFTLHAANRKSHSNSNTLVFRIVSLFNESSNISRSSISKRKSLPDANLDFKDTHLIKALSRSCKSRKYSESLYFLQLMVNKGYKPSVTLCIKLIKGLFSCGNFQNAVWVLDTLEKYGDPDVYSYNVVMSGFCKANRLDSAYQVLDRMKNRGLAPNVVTYNILIGSLCSRGKLELALKVLEQLLKDNCKPTMITYKIFIEATIVAGGVDEAMKLLDGMLLSGLQLDKMFIYNSIVRVLCREGLVDQALELINSISNKGFYVPVVKSYNILLHGLLNQGKWEVGQKLMSDMISRGCEPNVVTYSILISSLCRDGKVEEAASMLKAMKEKGLTPDAYSYHPLIAAFCKQSRVDSAIAFLDIMISDGCLPDIANYNTILASMCRNGKVNEALTIFEKLGEVGCPPIARSYNIMFIALWNCGHKIRALEMILEMLGKGIEADEVTYNSLLSCLCRDAMVDEAIGLLVDMEESNDYQPTVISYNTVLLGLSKLHRISDAIEVLAVMVDKGCMPNEATYSMLIEGIGYAGWPNDAIELAISLVSMDAIPQHILKRVQNLSHAWCLYKELILSDY